MYELGKYQGTIRKGYGKRKSLMKQYIKACKNEYKKDYREKKLDKSELDRILNNIDKFYYAFYSLSILLDMQRKVKILDSIAYYLRVLIREGLWVHGLYGYAARYLYDFNIFDTTPYARALLERFHEFESGPKGALTRYIVSLDDKSQEYIESLKDMVFNLSDKKSYDDVYLENIINYFEQLQNARGYVTRCYMLLAVFIYLIRRNKLHKALRFYDESQKYELPSGYLPGAFSVLRIALEIKLNREKIKHGSLFELLDYVKAYQDAFMDLRVVTDPAYNEDEIQYDANNFTLMRVIKMYNSMLANISTKSDIQPPYITGLLDNVERALDKINILIDKERVYDGETLAELITESKILSSRESKENLIGLFTGRHKYTLLQCIEKLGVLVDYVISPVDDIKNVMMLYGNNAENKNRRTLIYNALTIICGDDTKNNQSDPR
ncbi:membrane protein [Escherichia coli]|nr:membrane protein [Escherichia coli]